MTRRILIRVPNYAVTSVLSAAAAAVVVAVCPAQVRDGSRAASGPAAHSRPRAMTRTGDPDRAAALPIHHHHLHHLPDRVPAGALAAPVTAARGRPAVRVAPAAAASGRVPVPAVRRVPAAAACSDRAAAASGRAVVPAADRVVRRSGHHRDRAVPAAGRVSARARTTAAAPAADRALARGRPAVPAADRASARARMTAAVPVDARMIANPTCARRNPPAVTVTKKAAA